MGAGGGGNRLEEPKMRDSSRSLPCASSGDSSHPSSQSNSTLSTEPEADVALVALNALSSEDEAALEVVDVEDWDSFSPCPLLSSLLNQPISF